MELKVKRKEGKLANLSCRAVILFCNKLGVTNNVIKIGMLPGQLN